MRHYLKLPERVLVLAIYVSALSVACKIITGAWIPPSGGKSLWFFSSIALWFFTHLSAPFFVKPRDAVARSAAAALQLGVTDLSSVSQGRSELNLFRWLVFGVATLTSILGVAAIFLHRTDREAGSTHAYLSRVTYRFAERFGQGPIIFTPAVLISILGFYQDEPIQQLWLLFTWSILVFLRPVELVLHVIGDFRIGKSKGQKIKSIGEILRIDSPGILRIKLRSAEGWTRENIHAACLADGKHVEVLPLFVQTQNSELVGTGLCHAELTERIAGANPGEVFPNPNGRKKTDLLKDLSGNADGGDLIGFVVENSTIERIRFEVSSTVTLREGTLVSVLQTEDGESRSVYYQIMNAATEEEGFSQNPLGRHIATAEQIGVFDSDLGFIKYGWLPAMNSPVFVVSKSTKLPVNLSEDEFGIGSVPYSNILVGANLNDLAEYHTAILGVTGTGKTELAFDIIRFAHKRGFKIFCVDLTAEYEQRLKELNPQLMGLEQEDSDKLNQKISDVETGEFAAGKEKAALKDALDGLKLKIEEQAKTFLEPEEPALAILQLEDIANSRATLRITEMFLSSIFDWARQYRRARRVLIVLEEAHTVVPEMNFYGRYDRSETESVLGRTAQIALQGRKYGIGLLLISQRTALVSKTLLSQCNTVLSFAMYDETGLKYLGNVFSTEHVSAIPNLKRYQAIAFGKGIKSERPVIFQIAEDPAKKKASEELNKQWKPIEVPAAVALVEEMVVLPEGEAVDLAEDEDDGPPF